MDPAPVEKAITPRPGLLKSIGALNLVFGCFLFLCGLGCLNRFGPAMAQNQPLRFEPEIAQQVYDQLQRDLVADLENREKTAPSAEARAKLKRDRLALEAKHAKVEEQIDIQKINRDLLWLSWYLWADVASGPVLNLLMLAAGIGLIQLRPWARTLGIWVAALKIVRLVALTLLLMIAVIPHVTRTMEALVTTDLGKGIVAKAIADQNAKQGGAATGPVDPKEIVPWLNAFGNIYAVFGLAFGVIYPAVALVVLTRPGARAACIRSADDEAEETQGNPW